MPRRLRYQVAASLDGFIAGPGGEYDWIVNDSSIDFVGLFREFDTAVMGRRTWDIVAPQGAAATLQGLEAVVFSRTLPPSSQKGVRITGEDPATVVAQLKQQPGRDIWLFGGGVLFRALLDAGLVDTVEIALMPILLGEGIPVLPPGGMAKLKLADARILPRSGIVMLAYKASGSRAPAPRIGYIKAPKRRAAPRPRRGAKKTARRRAKKAARRRAKK